MSRYIHERLKAATVVEEDTKASLVLMLSNSSPLEHVVFTDFDGSEGILVDLNTKKYYQLNETAMLVWKALEKKKTLAEIVKDVISAYEVSSEHAEQSVQRLLQNLQLYKLVS